MQPESEPVAESREAEDTHDRILFAAQKLFAEKGFDATSVRDITTEAGCNVASVNYYFGGKDNLYLESFRTMMTVLRDRRLEVFSELVEREPMPSLEGYIESFALAMLDPLVENSRGRLFLDFVSREMIAPQLPPGVFLEEFIDPLMDRAVEGLVRVSPPLDRATARMCLMSMVGQLLHAFKAHHMFALHGRSDLMPDRLADYVGHFVRFSAGGICACAESKEGGTPDDRLPEDVQ